MKARVSVFVVALMTLLIAMVDPAGAQSKLKRKMTPAEIVAALKPGQWVQMEGIVQKDFSVLCTEAQILTGDFLDDDWAITAVARRVDIEKQEIHVLNLPVKTQKETEFQGADGKAMGFADVKVGMLLDIEGTYLKDGTFLAKEVDDESNDLITEPGLKDEVEVMGKVGKVDTAKRTVTVMGILFQLTDKTKGKSVIK
jgi:hypothetical protein